MQIHWGKLSPGCQIELVLGLIVLVPLCCFLAWVLGIRLEALGHVLYIQQALDEQYGEGVLVADAAGFNGDPGPSWHSGEQHASCFQDRYRSWIRYCLEPLTPTPTNTPDLN